MQAKKLHHVDDEWDAIQAAGVESPRAALADQFSGAWAAGKRGCRLQVDPIGLSWAVGSQCKLTVPCLGLLGAYAGVVALCLAPTVTLRAALWSTRSHRPFAPPSAPSHARRQFGPEPAAHQRPRLP